MSNTNDDTNMTGNADNCDPLRTKSGQGERLKVAAHTEEQIRAFCRSHMLPRQNVVRIRKARDLYGWRPKVLLLLPSWWLGTDSDAVYHAKDRGWKTAEVTEDEVLNGPTQPPPAPVEETKTRAVGKSWVDTQLVEEIAKDIEERILPQAFKEWYDRSFVDEINMRVSANFADAMRKATTPVEAQTGHGLTSMIELGLEPVPITKRPTPETDAQWQTECCSGASWYRIAERMKNRAADLERQLAEVTSQRDAAHQKCREYRIVALGAEDALEKMTAQRDEIVEALGKMLSAFNIMESSEERDVWESAHSVWFMMKGNTNSIDALVNRFLSWKLPESVRVDRIAYEPAGHFDRYGTNLLSASEAKQMIEHLLGVKIQIDESVPDDTVIVKGGEA